MGAAGGAVPLGRGRGPHLEPVLQGRPQLLHVRGVPLHAARDVHLVVRVGQHADLPPVGQQVAELAPPASSKNDTRTRRFPSPKMSAPAASTSARVVCVFPVPVCPNMNTVASPFPWHAQCTSDRVVFAYTSALESGPSKTRLAA